MSIAPTQAEVKTAHEIRAEYMRVFRGVPEYTARGLSVKFMQEQLDSLHKPSEAKPSPKASTSKSAAKKTSQGRFEKLNRFMDCGIMEGKLSLSAQAVWHCLYRHEKDGVTRASVDQIATTSNMAARSVYRGLRELTKKGFVKCIKRGTSRGNSSRYVISPTATTDIKSPVGKVQLLTKTTIATDKNDTPTEESKDSDRKAGGPDERSGTAPSPPPGNPEADPSLQVPRARDSHDRR